MAGDKRPRDPAMPAAAERHPGRSARVDLSALMAACTERREWLTKLLRRTRARSEREQMCMMMVYCSLEHEKLREQQRSGGRAPAWRVDVYASELLGVGHNKLAALYKDFCGGKAFKMTTAAANRITHRERLDGGCPAVREAVRVFLRQKHAAKERIIEIDILRHLVEKEMIAVDMDDHRDVDSATRCLGRFLRKHGFRRGKRRGKHSMAETAALKTARAVYLMALTTNEEEDCFKAARYVFLDESVSCVLRMVSCHQL